MMGSKDLGEREKGGKNESVLNPWRPWQGRFFPYLHCSTPLIKVSSIVNFPLKFYPDELNLSSTGTLLHCKGFPSILVTITPPRKTGGCS